MTNQPVHVLAVRLVFDDHAPEGEDDTAVYAQAVDVLSPLFQDDPSRSLGQWLASKADLESGFVVDGFWNVEDIAEAEGSPNAWTVTAGLEVDFQSPSGYLRREVSDRLRTVASGVNALERWLSESTGRRVRIISIDVDGEQPGGSQQPSEPPDDGDDPFRRRIGPTFLPDDDL